MAHENCLIASSYDHLPSPSLAGKFHTREDSIPYHRRQSRIIVINTGFVECLRIVSELQYIRDLKH